MSERQQVTLWRGIIKLQEEMAELGVELSKLSVVPNGQHWDERPRRDGTPGAKPLRERVKKESADVLAAVTYFIEKNFSQEEIEEIRSRVSMKRGLYDQWVMSGIPAGGLK